MFTTLYEFSVTYLADFFAGMYHAFDIICLTPITELDTGFPALNGFLDNIESLFGVNVPIFHLTFGLGLMYYITLTLAKWAIDLFTPAS